MFMKEKIEKLKSSQGNGESKEIQEPANGTGTAKKKSGLAREGIAYLIFGVLTTDNIEQAIERAGTKAGNKGYDVAVSAIEMVNLFKNL